MTSELLISYFLGKLPVTNSEINALVLKTEEYFFKFNNFRAKFRMAHFHGKLTNYTAKNAMDCRKC